MARPKGECPFDTIAVLRSLQRAGHSLRGRALHWHQRGHSEWVNISDGVH